jgi:hypothetical protein
MERIREFLGQKRFAMVGVSRRPEHLSRALYREFSSRGYELVPVNPEAEEIEGQACFARLQEIQPPVDTVLLVTAPEGTENAVQDCVQTGVKRVWMYRGASNPGAVSASAVRFCEDHGIAVIPGQCPFMFLPGTHWFHRLHGFVKKIAGSYPR